MDSYCDRKQRYKDLITLGYSERRVKVCLQAVALSYCGQALSKKDLLYQDASETVK